MISPTSCTRSRIVVLGATGLTAAVIADVKAAMEEAEDLAIVMLANSNGTGTAPPEISDPIKAFQAQELRIDPERPKRDGWHRGGILRKRGVDRSPAICRSHAILPRLAPRWRRGIPRGWRRIGV